MGAKDPWDIHDMVLFTLCILLMCFAFILAAPYLEPHLEKFDEGQAKPFALALILSIMLASFALTLAYQMTVKAQMVARLSRIVPVDLSPRQRHFWSVSAGMAAVMGALMVLSIAFGMADLIPFQAIAGLMAAAGAYYVRKLSPDGP